jgi:hypothetical protein
VIGVVPQLYELIGVIFNTTSYPVCVHHTMVIALVSSSCSVSFCFNVNCYAYCRFDQCAVSALSLQGIKDAGYEKLTWVQAATLPIILQGQQ